MKMRAIAVMISSTMILFSQPTAQAGEKEEVVEWIQAHLLGRGTGLTITTKIDNGAIETDFQRTSKYHGLVLTEKGFMLDETILIKQTLFELDENGLRILPGSVKDRALVVRHAYREMESTGKLLGSSRIISNSNDDSTGVVSLSLLSLKEGKLVQRLKTVGYADYFAKGGGHSPGANETVNVLSLVEGKLIREQTVITYDVDPETLEWTKRDEDPAKYREEEVTTEKK